MCGRFMLCSPANTVGTMFGVDIELLPPRWNITPTQSVAIIRSAASERELALLRWGLVPSWSKDLKSGARLINARSETVGVKPSFRAAMQSRRCVVPADGYYEWMRDGDVKRPFCMRRVGGEPFGMAGLWESWTSPVGEIVQTCCILTCSPNRTLASIHDRMPVILGEVDFDQWLQVDRYDVPEVEPLMRLCSEDYLHAFEVSSHVNRPANDDQTCCEPIVG
ncbi:MAG: SOS response-associated peptidase [Phycisphaerales bacterium]|nr:SOS response-associated peptidase [Phycisphaerales bacterium]